MHSVAETPPSVTLQYVTVARSATGRTLVQTHTTSTWLSMSDHHHVVYVPRNAPADDIFSRNNPSLIPNPDKQVRLRRRINTGSRVQVVAEPDLDVWRPLNGFPVVETHPTVEYLKVNKM